MGFFSLEVGVGVGAAPLTLAFASSALVERAWALAFAFTIPLWATGPLEVGLAPALEAILAKGLVGELISIGSPGEGAVIWILGVGIGTIRLVMWSSEQSARVAGRWGVSATAAICAVG